MANTKKDTHPLSDSEKLRQKRTRRAVLAIILLALLTGIIVTFLIGAKTLLFTANKRLLLRQIEIRSPGFWAGKEKQLCRKIELELPVNLFALDLAQLRQKLKEIPSIEEAEICRILPDTLQIKLHERFPRAQLNSPASPWVVDENAVLIPKRECSAEKMQLPVISGVAVTDAHKLSDSEIKRIRPALTLLTVVARKFPNLQVYFLQSRTDGQLEFNVRYYRQEMLTVTLPATTSKSRTEVILEALQSAVVDAKKRGDTRTHFNLLYNGQVVIY